MEKNEIFELGSIHILVSKEHRFGTDAVMLAEFAAPKRIDAVCDLCTGCGIIPLMFCRNIADAPKEIYGVEIQESAANLFRESIELNNLGNRVHCVNADLREIEKSGLRRGYFDMVTVNPPYFKENSGRRKISPEQAAARHEILCKPEDFVRAADYLLKYGGFLKLCHLPERLCDILTLLRGAKIEPKTLTFIQNKPYEKPWLFLLSAKKGASSGLTVETIRTESF